MGARCNDRALSGAGTLLLLIADNVGNITNSDDNTTPRVMPTEKLSAIRSQSIMFSFLEKHRPRSRA